mmetsp:Transcript_88069/g.247583  ORF Transcript_88069/g.247583 Transcript_88069/m.247583 type:complete len:218 (-) Transcript_88069:904-1557(-)
MGGCRRALEAADPRGGWGGRSSATARVQGRFPGRAWAVSSCQRHGQFADGDFSQRYGELLQDAGVLHFAAPSFGRRDVVGGRMRRFDERVAQFSQGQGSSIVHERRVEAPREAALARAALPTALEGVGAGGQCDSDLRGCRERGASQSLGTRARAHPGVPRHTCQNSRLHARCHHGDAGHRCLAAWARRACARCVALRARFARGFGGPRRERGARGP